MSHLATLLMKDIKYELRTGETIVTCVAYALLLATLVSFGVQNAFLEPADRSRLIAPILWVLFIFTTAIALNRSFVFETKTDALSALTIADVSFGTFYISKCMLFFAFSVIVHLIQTVIVSFMFQVTALFTTDFVLLSLITIIAFVGLFTLLLGIAHSSKLGGVLLPILLFPLLFPLFFATTELAQSLITTGSLDLSSFWFSLVVSLAIFYPMLGYTLFPVVIKE